MKRGILLIREMKTRYSNEEGWKRSHVSGYKQTAQNNKSKQDTNDIRYVCYIKM
jgi:hypothetical protein